MADENQKAAAAAGQAPDAPLFDIIRIYAKDSSLETPETPAIFREAWKPEIGVEFDQKNNKIEDDQYEVTLRVTVTCKNAGKTAYVVEVNMAGLFLIRNVPEDGMEYLINATAPNILFPYAREFISSLINRGTFPQLNLQPLNFEALFRAKKIQEMQKNAGAEGAASSEVAADKA